MGKTITFNLLDVNNFQMEDSFEIDLVEELSKELTKQLKELEKSGIELSLSSIGIKDPRIFYNWILDFIFGRIYTVEDHQSDNGGVPDFKLTLKQGLDPEDNSLKRALYFCFFRNKLPTSFWVEVKRNNDGLSQKQFEWILENKDKEKIFVLFIKEK